MRRGREGGLILELRKELGLFVRLCLLVLAGLFAHPFAMANAATAGPTLSICSQSDASKHTDRTQTHGLPGDCACCFACSIAAAPVVAVADGTFRLPTNSGEKLRQPETPPVHQAAVRERPPARAPPCRA